MMKTNLQKTILRGLLAFLLVFSFTSVKAQTLAGWTFDTTAAAPGTPIVLLANLGAQSSTASLFANGTNGSSTWVTATTGNELTAFAGSTTNDPRTTPVAGLSYCPVAGTANAANGKAIVFKLSTSGFENPILTYATRNTASGFQTQQWAWSTDGISFTNITPAISSITTSFGLRTINLSAINAIDNATVVYLKLTVSGATTSTGNNRIDNVFVNATVLSVATTPTVATLAPATAITATSASLAGNVTNIGGSPILVNGIAYGETSLVPNPTLGSLDVTDLPFATPGFGTFSSATINPLAPNTQYSYRAYATNTQGTAYGSAATFYTLANVPNSPVVGNPTISTLDVSVGSGDGNPLFTTQYAIQVDGGLYVQANGSLGATAVWQTAINWATTTVTGLLSNTSYSFAAKARNTAGIETAFGSAVSESTLINLSAELIVSGALSAFGDNCINASAANSFVFSGTNLDGSALVINALSGFTFSDTEFGSYTPTLTISYVGTAVTGRQVWVQFSPTLVQSYDGVISISGAGLLANVDVAATGAGINTPGTATTGTATAITASGVNLSGTALAGCSPIVTIGIEYSLTNIFTASSFVLGSPSVVTGLVPNTQYFYRVLATDGSGTLLGLPLSFTTANIAAPIATPATAIQDVSFIANWNPSNLATSYNLDVSTSPTFGVTANASNLIISEYGEGSGGNKKYIEIYNGTGASVNLANYEIWKNVNGSNWNFNSSAAPTAPLSLTGTLANGTTYVIANNATDVIGANLYSTFLSFNGDDAAGLAYNGGSGTTFALLDAVGVQGIDPGTGWAVAGITNATVDKILIRKPAVLTPNANWTTSAGTDTTSSEWIVSPIAYNATNQTTNLGAHTIDTGVASYLPGYENLSVSGTSQIVTGLTLGNTYYYRVSATSATSTSVESNVISAVTVVPFKTKVIASQCNSTIAGLSTLILVDIIPTATQYRFKVTNPASTSVIYETPNRYFRITNLASYEFATTYNVEVELQIAGVWTGYYGDVCAITTPALPVLTVGTACVTNITTRFSGITTTNVAGALQYKFRVLRVAPGAVAQEVTSNWNGFLMHYIGGFVYGATYQVQVAVKTPGSSAFSAYGSPCTLNTPAVPTLAAGSCDATITSNFQAISTTNLLSNATGYKFEITSLAGVVFVEGASHWFYPTAIPGYVAGTNYSVRVAVKNGADISEYGEACELNPVVPARFGQAGTPSAAVTDFKAVGYPNPFATNFILNVTTTSDEKLQVAVYDMIGKQLESKEVNATDANAFEVGANYPSGVYNVIVSQGVYVKSLRMIKR